ncbi:alpha-glucosidase/alpha-galactosidase [Cephaloticoccus primus]|uniref:Alpha-glucosidase/alpha-galactosidase n=1 Tax=Cephaloticoccus primus TaxID=1548207 RepID=A0A139STT8_9BACT|nr:alpha-glucosidase/alpha-galactosidase [Cephaloticoccus primus]KXU37851.1 alpha-glucosidase/alpha-galactosidase [Cephaloticoccus primus]
MPPKKSAPKTPSLKIAFIGAGSIGFTRKLVADLLTVPEFANIELSFTDINKRNLDMVAEICRRDIAANGLKTKIRATTNRRDALRDANYVFCVVRIGGIEAFQYDIEIPLKYGIDQCVGDTLCAGGIMYGQRGIAAILDFCKDIREVAAPNCLLLNYANPMAMMTWAATVYGGVRTVGLCHGVQGGIWAMSQVLGVEESEVDVICAGINHQTWYTTVRVNGRDVSTEELLAAFERHPIQSKTEKVRIDMIRRFGHYSTESNGHLSEYLPWYRKRPGEIKKWIGYDSWIQGETGGYLRVVTEGRHWFEEEFGGGKRPEPFKFTPENRSAEHGSHIVEALETGRVYRHHFNQVNGNTISNLPADAIIEAPGFVDRFGINMPQYGDLPLGCAAVCNASISVQRLAVEAAVKGDIQLLRQAMLIDPLVGAVCNPPEVWQLVDEMLVAQAQWLPQYGKAIREAKARLAKGPLIKTREGYRGAARKKVRSNAEIRAQEKANPRAGH